MPRGARQRDRAKKQPRGTRTERGYTNTWIRYSARFRSEPENAICAHCRSHGRTRASECVDHIVRVTGPEDERFWDRSNHQALCHSCHAIKTQTERSDHTVQTQPVIVCGAPGSGKTTYVTHHRSPLDLVWDLDAIAAALNPVWSQYHDRPDDVAGVLLSWRRDLVERIRTRSLQRRSWLIITDRDTARSVCDTLAGRLVTLPECRQDGYESD